jgi:uncharacterized protein (DUF58 family)
MPTSFAITLLLLGCPAAFLAGAASLGWAIILLYDVILLSLFLLDHALAGRAAGSLKARRTHGSIISCGRQESVTLAVTGGSERSLTLRIVEALAPIAEPQEVSFPTFTLPAGGEKELVYRFVPSRRGTWPVGPAVARVMGPMRLAWRQVRLAEPTPVKVYPDIKLIERYQNLLRRNRLQPFGISPAAHPGQGTWFESLREFVPGDEPSKIEWKATARRGKIIVKNFQAERSQTVQILIDSGKMMTTIIEGRSRLDYAVDSALLLSHVIISKGDRAGLILFSEKIRKLLPPEKNAAQVKRIADALHDASASLVEPDTVKAVMTAASRRKRSLIILLTDIWGREAAQELVFCARRVMPAHLLLVIMMRDRDMEAAASGKGGAEGLEESFTMAAACQLMHERSETIAQLRSMGALVLDVYPKQVTAGAIRKYLEVKARNMI